MSDSPFAAVTRSVRWRCYLGFGVVALALLALLLGSVLSLERIAERLRTVVDGPVEEALLVKELRTRVLGMGFIVHHYVSDEDPLYARRYRHRVQEVVAELERLMARPGLSPSQQAVLRRALEEWRVFEQVVEDLYARRGLLDHGQLTARLDDVAAHLARIANTLDRVTDESIDRMHDEVEGGAALRRQSLVLLAALFVGGLVLAFAIGARLLRSVVAPLRELEDCVRCLQRPVPLPPVDKGDVEGAVRTMSGQLQRVARVLEAEAAHDPLTNLYSFRQFCELLEREIHRANRYHRPFALLLIDIDRFRMVNERFGYLAGDSVLCSVAARIQSHVRPTDVAARYGGEEIAVLLSETDEEGALETAERIRRTVAASPFNMGEARTLRVTVSVGVALFPDDAEDVAGLFRAAEGALQAAQRSGMNRVCSWSELRHFG